MCIRDSYKSEPAPPPEPVKDAIPIPDPKSVPKKVTKEPPKPAPPAKSVPAEDTPPENAVPYGQGGKPALQYGQFQGGAGTMGVGFGEGAFGDRYGWYVQSMTRQISQNWLQGTIDSSIRTAPRVYMRFVIARDGSVSSIEKQQSSGIPALDVSAERALRRASPLPPLPPDYRGSSITVSFYFEYKR